MTSTTATASKTNHWIPDLGIKGWGVTATCIGFYFFYNFWNNGSNTLFSLFTEMYGWQTTQMSMVVTISGWASLVGILLFGIIGHRIGARNVSIIGLIGNVVAFAILALMNNFTMFVIGVLLFFVTMTAYAVIGLGKLGSSWFPHKKGMFMGMATMGMTLNGACINAVVVACAGSSIGISGFFWGCAVLCALLAVVTFLFVKDNPEEAGAWPDNDRSISREQLERDFAAAEEYKKHSPWTVSKVLKTPQTWLIGLGWGIAMLAASGTMALLAPTLVSYGHELTFAILLMGTMWPFGMLGHYIIGVLDQKFGTKNTTFVVVAMMILAGALVFFFGSNNIVCAVAVALLMFSISGNANVCMSMTTTVFGRQDFEMAWTPIQIIYNICNFAGVTVMAMVGAIFGQPSVMMALVVICVVSLIPIGLCSSKQIGSQIK
ncbi:MFS transporter [Bifidobacterium simiarum]|uniref:MFS transporter n=1 Tax=Bifidobacterium simiarum TaxID=2045441 RepID=A0A2M9HG72_9BIFI|nr:MFS transporter [Bifidobacterium simiarum]PJM75781.1 MFS transporter [Bifidobacterium simiarum]